VREAAAAAEEKEIAVGVNEMPVDGFDLPPGVTSDEFSLYVAVDADVQTAAEVTDEELCAVQQAAGDVDTDGEISSEATGEADDSRQHISGVHCTLNAETAVQSTTNVRLLALCATGKLNLFWPRPIDGQFCL